MMYEIPSYIFHCPSNIVIYGATQVGKTFFIKRLLNNLLMFSIKPERIIYCYSLWQDAFNDIKGVEFRHGVDISDGLGGQHTLIILDDLMSEVVKSKSAEELFVRGSHHKNISVIFVVQNLYPQGQSARSIMLNRHYLVLMENKQGKDQIKNLGQKMLMTSTVMEAYTDCMNQAEKKDRYLFIDASPHNTNPDLILKSKIFPGDYQVIYLPL